MEFRRPKDLLNSLGLIRGKQNIISEQCRDTKQIRVIEDSISKVIYLDWDNNFKHYVNYSDTRSNKFNFCYEDHLNTSRRIKEVLPFIGTKNILDYGCGQGSLIKELGKIIGNERCLGLEKSQIIRKNLNDLGIKTFSSLKEIDREISLILCFHVLEHLDKPEDFLKETHCILKKNCGQLIIEVPHANDPMIRLYKNKEFMNFTFWSQHLILHTTESLRILCGKSGFKEVTIALKQRYPLSNHLHWIINGKPGGHKSNFSMIDNESLSKAYSNSLSKIGFSDTLYAICKA